MLKPQVVIVGFSGNAREAFENINNSFEVISFLDERKELHAHLFAGVPIADFNTLSDHQDAGIICLIGSEKSFILRKRIIDGLNLPRSRYVTAVDPTASVSRFATVGIGTLISPGVRIMGNAQVGDHVIILPNSVIHHDAKIGDYSLIGSNVVIAGEVVLDQSCYIGSGSQIKNGIRIGAGALVGLGANVLRDVMSRQTMVGNPARPLTPG